MYIQRLTPYWAKQQAKSGGGISDDMELKAVQNAGSYKEIVDGRKNITTGLNYASYIYGGAGLLKIGYKGYKAIRFVNSKYAYKIFDSKYFGVSSKYFGNSVTRTQGILNTKTNLIKIGWSNAPAKGGGMIFRISSRSQKWHFDIPGTFVPNSTSNLVIIFLQNFGKGL